MEKLLEHGVNVWDEYKKEHFNLNVIIFCISNDNPARLALTRQVKGKIEYVICMDRTESIYLPSSCKLVYMRHRRFLPPKQRYHQWRSRFNGTIENREASKHRDGKFVFEMIKNINVVFGKPVKGMKRKKSVKPPKDSPFKKQSIFFWYLPYWKEFEIGHASDTMHIEKGFFKSTIGLLLDISSTFKLLKYGMSYIHKKDRTKRLTFLQLATPSQLRRKGQFASVCTGLEFPQDSQQT
jgi:hypothetical protein